MCNYTEAQPTSQVVNAIGDVQVQTDSFMRKISEDTQAWLAGLCDF